MSNEIAPAAKDYLPAVSERRKSSHLWVVRQAFHIGRLINDDLVKKADRDGHKLL